MVLCLLSPTHTHTHTGQEREKMKRNECEWKRINDKKCDCDLPATQLLHFVLYIFYFCHRSVDRSFVLSFFRYHKISFALRHENFAFIMNASVPEPVHTFETFVIGFIFGGFVVAEPLLSLSRRFDML